MSRKQRQQEGQIAALRVAIDAWSQSPPVKSRVSCQGEGCFGCCRGDIVVAPGEAEEIATHLTPELEARVQNFQPGHPDLAYCPLLVQGRCAVYAVRPLSCRAYHSESPQIDCYPEVVGVKPIRMVVPHHAGLGALLIGATERGGQRILLSELKRLVGKRKKR